MNSFKEKPPVWSFLLLFLLALMGVVAAQQAGLFKPVDNWFFDLLTGEIRKLDRQPLQQDVVIVGLDEAYMSGRSEPFSLIHEDLGHFFNTMALAHPRLVLVDIVLPEKSWRNLARREAPEFNYDLALVRGLLNGSKHYHLVLAKTWDASNRRYRNIFEDFIAAAQIGEMNQAGVLASAIICTDNDQVVRHYPDATCQPDQGATPPVAELAQFKLEGQQRLTGLIDFTIGDDFQYIPLTKLLAQPSAETLKLFENKVVLMGSVLPLEDRQKLPVPLTGWEPGETFQSGVLIHAQILRSILNRGLIQEPHAFISMMISLSGLIFLFGRALLRKTLLLTFFIGVSAGLAWYLCLMKVFVPVSSAWLTAIIAMSLRSGMDYVTSDRERKFLKKTFGGLVSPDVMKAILNGKIQPHTRGQKVHAAVLFSDIRGFTTLSEALAPDKLISLLNDYLSAMTDVVHDHQGTVISFMGDGIMAAFGCPGQLDYPEKEALASAKAMLMRLEQFNSEHEETPLRIGIGIHSGEVMAGNVGSSSRYEFTVIGDVVNSSSRLEGLTKELGFPIVLSSEVVSVVGMRAEFSSLGMVPIKGRQPMALFGWNPKVVPCK